MSPRLNTKQMISHDIKLKFYVNLLVIDKNLSFKTYLFSIEFVFHIK